MHPWELRNPWECAAERTLNEYPVTCCLVAAVGIPAAAGYPKDRSEGLRNEGKPVHAHLCGQHHCDKQLEGAGMVQRDRRVRKQLLQNLSSRREVVRYRMFDGTGRRRVLRGFDIQGPELTPLQVSMTWGVTHA